MRNDILVTGATGFTGGALCRHLVEEGHRVTAFVRSTSRTADLARLGVQCLETDITDTDAVLRSFRPFDRVFHIAAAYRTEHADRLEFMRVNVGATENLLKAAKQTGIGRFIHCSTVGIHGQIDDPPANEEYRPQPNDHYQQSKLEGEQVARRHFAQGLPGTVVRPAGIYGPGDLRFLKLFRAVNRRAFVMIGDGSTLYHFTYIDDLIAGFLLAAEHPEALGEVFIIAGPTHNTVRETVDIVADVLGRPHPRLRVPFWPVHAAAVLCEAVCRPLRISPPLFPRRVEFFSMDRSFSTEKARRRLGFEPKVGLREGFERTAAWYRQQGLL